MTFYIRNINSFRVSDNPGAEVHEKLPVGTYIIEQDQFGNYYLNLIEDFQQPRKIYGNTLRHADRILRTFMDRPSSTGVMLAGEKGSGKSLLAKMLSTKAREQGVATIVINRPWCGDSFNKLMQDIQQPVIVLFDEFEKVYGEGDQEQILTLFDGMFPTKKLFVLTCNDKWRIDRHMRNRPGRIYYMLDFKGLDVDFIREYCEENLLNQENLEGVIKISSLFSEFNFDMLKAMVEEMNRYGETAQEVMSMLNTKPEYSEVVEYDMQMTVDGIPVDETDLGDSRWRGNPMVQHINTSYFEAEPGQPADKEDPDGDWVPVKMTPKNLKSVDGSTGRFVFQNGRACIILTKKKPETVNYYDMM